MSTDLGELCDMTELPKSTCDHCRHNDKTIVDRLVDEPDPRPSAIGDVFAAKFKGTCIECREEIVPGDHIGVVNEIKDGEGKVTHRQYAHYGCMRA